MIKRNKMIQSTEAEATINVVTFEPDNKDDIIGIIQIVHGMTEYIERYSEFAKYFTENCPARVCVEVSRLPKDVLIEIDVIAAK